MSQPTSLSTQKLIADSNLLLVFRPGAGSRGHSASTFLRNDILAWAQVGGGEVQVCVTNDRQEEQIYLRFAEVPNIKECYLRLTRIADQRGYVFDRYDDRLAEGRMKSPVPALLYDLRIGLQPDDRKLKPDAHGILAGAAEFIRDTLEGRVLEIEFGEASALLQLLVAQPVTESGWAGTVDAVGQRHRCALELADGCSLARGSGYFLAKCLHPMQLTTKVSQMMADGWIPQGGAAVAVGAPNRYFQGLVRPETLTSPHHV